MHLTRTIINRNGYRADVDELMYVVLWSKAKHLTIKEWRTLVEVMETQLTAEKVTAVGGTKYDVEWDMRKGLWLHKLSQDAHRREDFSI